MAHIPGERFEIDLGDDESVAPHELPKSRVATTQSDPVVSASTAAVPGFIGDVLERETVQQVAPPSFRKPATTTGFPEHKKRTGISKFKQDRGGAGNAPAAPTPVQVSTSTTTSDIGLTEPTPTTPARSNGVATERQQIDQENRRTMASMSDAEIQQERQELFAGLSAGLIEKLLKRSNIDEDNAPTQYTDNFAGPEPKPHGSENRRPSASERRVSFALPEEKIQEKEPTSTASRHSITSSPSPMLAAKIGTPSSSDVSELGLSRTSSNTSIASRRSSSSHGHERKVSFVLPDYIELARKASPTAARHSVSSPMTLVSDKVEPIQTPDITELDLSKMPSSSAMKSPKQRPVNHERKVSFALPDDERPGAGDRRGSSASRHSITSLPSPKFMDKMQTLPADPREDLDLAATTADQVPVPSASTSEHAHSESAIHFPQAPAAPELDPNSETFLTDLHEKYFPNLAHDPSKLAWMAPADSSENSYDPSRSSFDAKDVRFDFKGRIIPPSKSAAIPTDIGLHHHGDAPSAAGYTISELALLARSAFPAQRCLAIQTLGRFLYRLGMGEFGDENLIHATVAPTGVSGGVTEEEVQKAMLARGLWDAVEGNRVTDTLSEWAGREAGHRTSIVLAQEAVWNWRKGGGRRRRAV